MSNFLTITNLTGGNVGSAPAVFSAASNDTLATITTAGYVSDLLTQNLIKANDIIRINYALSGTAGFGTFRVISSGSGSLIAEDLDSCANGLTAHAGGTQGPALQLYAGINRITTVATGNDSVKLPSALPGMKLVVINAAASNSMNVFPQSGEQINVVGTNNAFAMVANKTAIFYCALAGQWNSILTA